MEIAEYKLDLINKIIELYFKLIEQSENDFLNGRITKHSDFEKESLQW